MYRDTSSDITLCQSEDLSIESNAFLWSINTV